MHFDCSFRQTQGSADVLVRLALDNKVQDLALTLAEIAQLRPPRFPGDVFVTDPVK
jgi:hypothetical protein